MVPRKKSRAITVYICEQCLADPKLKTRRRLIECMLTAAIDAQG